MNNQSERIYEISNDLENLAKKFPHRKEELNRIMDNFTEEMEGLRFGDAKLDVVIAKYSKIRTELINPTFKGDEYD